VTWSGRLTRYIHLYGLKFSKEDHLQFIKLFYELTLIPNLEATLISVFANVLVSLLRKQHLISPDELQLPWRPLYSMVQRILDSPYEPLGLFLVPSGNSFRIFLYLILNLFLLNVWFHQEWILF